MDGEGIRFEWMLSIHSRELFKSRVNKFRNKYPEIKVIVRDKRFPSKTTIINVGVTFVVGIISTYLISLWI